MSSAFDEAGAEAMRLRTAIGTACARAGTAVDASRDLSSLLRPEPGAEALEESALETCVLEAAEAVLGAHGGAPGGGVGALEALSAANLRDLSLLLERRPPFAPPVLAALFQLSVTVAKHAPAGALGASGCRLLVALLELLSALPRAHAAGDAPGLLRIARIATRNVMRRVGPQLFAASSAATARVDAALLPWIERHLLPLHAVSGAEARADLREDRRLALVLLDYAQREADLSSEALDCRVRAQYLADAARVLLHEDGAMEPQERERLAAFLARAEGKPSEAPAAAPQQSGEAAVPLAAAREFLCAREKAYAREAAELRAHVRAERGTAGVLQRQLDEATAERDAIVRGIQQSARAAGGEGAREWAEEVLSLAQRVEELAVARHGESPESH